MVFLFTMFFWTCVTRKKEKLQYKIFTEKANNTHIWFIKVLFRRRKSGGVGRGFVCVAFSFGFSYHTQAQPLPLEFTRRLWIVLTAGVQQLRYWLLQQRKAWSLYLSLNCCGEKSRSVVSHVPAWYQGAK